jgi:hypothetical protein
MVTLQDVIEKIMEKIKVLEGMRGATDYPPGQMPMFPFAIAYAGAADWEVSPVGTGKALQEVIIEIHMDVTDQIRSIQKLMPYNDSVPMALLADVTLGGTCQTFARVRSEGIIKLGYAKIDTIGFKFHVEGIKILTGL